MSFRSGRLAVLDNGDSMWRKLAQHSIGLEKVEIENKDRLGQYVLAIMGRIRVANYFYEKSLFARVTFDNWATYQDYHGSYLKSAEDGSNDTFSFGFTRRDRNPLDVEFAVCCVQGGRHYWDNNNGGNYKFHLAADPFA